MSKIVIPNLQKEKIEKFLDKEAKRFDGRNATDHREILVEDNISPAASSAIRVKVGKTEVLAGVHLTPTTPYADSPDQGTFMTTAELHPIASQQFDSGKPSINAIELGRIIDRGIRESGFIDFKELCIEPGEKVWQVFLDIVAINDDGNLLDVAGIASLIALGRARMPAYNKEDGTAEHEFVDEPIPLNKEAMSLNITLHKIGQTITVDVNKEEEAISKLRLSIAIGDNNGKPRITAMQKGKSGTINSKDMESILKIVQGKWLELFPKVKEYAFG